MKEKSLSSFGLTLRWYIAYLMLRKVFKDIDIDEISDEAIMEIMKQKNILKQIIEE